MKRTYAISILSFLLAACAVWMKTFSGALSTLDTRLFYSGTEAIHFLLSLTPVEAANYLSTEKIDLFAFIPLYVALLSACSFGESRKWQWLTVAFAAAFDLFETTTLVFCLAHHDLPSHADLLAASTSLKWLGIFAWLCLVVLEALQVRRRRRKG